MKTSVWQSKRFVLTLTLTMCCVAFSVFILGLAIAFNKAPNSKSTSAQYIYGNNSIVKLEVIDDITLQDDTIEKLQPKIQVTSTGKQGEFGALVKVTSQNVIFDYTLDNQKHTFAAVGPGISLDDGGTSGGCTSIYNAEQLKTFRDKVNSGEKNYSGEIVKLEADIDLNNEEWEPIGKPSGNSSAMLTKFFMGTFNGNGHTISKFKITKAYQKHYLYDAASTRQAYGFFGFVDGATIKNLYLDNVTINLKKFENRFYGVGVLVGYSEGNLTIDSCTVNNSSISYDYTNCANAQIAGLVGWINTYITDRSNGTTQVDYENSGNIRFTFCSFINSSINTDNTKGTGRYVGGLYGYAYEGSANTKSFAIDNCMVVANFNFTNTSSDGKIYLCGIGPNPYCKATVTKSYEKLTYSGQNIAIYHLLGKKSDKVVYDDHCRYYENGQNKEPS